MRIMRKVVNTRIYDRVGFAPGGFGIINVLECGHEIGTKGSAGYANKRRCFMCESLAHGGASTTNGIRETWDENTQMPKREPVIK